LRLLAAARCPVSTESVVVCSREPQRTMSFAEAR
jgi:hypothetical protein